MRHHSVNAHPNNTYAKVDGLWKSATGEWYGWADTDMYPCSAAPVPNYGPQDHSGCHQTASEETGSGCKTLDDLLKF